MRELRRPQRRPFGRTALRTLPLLLVLATVLSVLTAAPAAFAAKQEKKLNRKEIKAATEKLDPKYQAWLTEVDVLITDEELTAFLALEKDYQRDAFIKRFWEVRDAYMGTTRNEFHDRWEANLREVKARYGDLKEQRARMFLLNGAPSMLLEPRCTLLVPMEIWFYQRSEKVRGEFLGIFYRRWGAGPYQLWNPAEGLGALFQDNSASMATPGGGSNRSLTQIRDGCPDGDRLARAVAWVLNQGVQGYSILQARFESKPEPPKGEWIATFESYSTDVPEGAALLTADFDVTYPGRHQARTVLQAVVGVEASSAGVAQLADHRSYNFSLNGEIIQNGELFDSFRYKFDFPAAPSNDAAAAAGKLPLVFQRYARPGEYKIVLKLEDLNSQKVFRAERTLTVPEMDASAPPPPPSTPEEVESARILAEANAAISRGETTLKIIPPRGELQTGMLRFDTLTTGDIAKVTFAMDGKPVLTKKKPPFSVELDMGQLPRPRKLSAMAYDAAGHELATDELMVNAAGHRFRVNLVEPQKGKHYQNSLLARAETDVPDGEAIERVEFYLNETLVATLYQPPYVQPIVLPKGNPVGYVRSVAYLPDGNQTEDLVFINSPDPDYEELEIEFVELYTSAFDRNGRPVQSLEQKDVTIVEDGVKQEIVRFERVTDLPIHTAVALDISASMTDSLEKARDAALQYFQETVQPRDRAALVTFNDRPTLNVKFTNNKTTLAGGLAGMKAERGTSLYDTVIFSLYYFTGIKGQRALLLVSDGKDESSRFTYEDAVDYARRAGVTIYAIGLSEEVGRKKLTKLSEETGGRAFFLENVAELSGIYSTIEEELRSKYLIAYQSTNTTGTDFRTVDLKVSQPGVEAKTIRGYYP
jgi:Ca-activated chloride channel family protein